MKINKANLESKYLAQSVLLEEEASPHIFAIIIWFFSIIVVLFIIWASFMNVDEVALAPGKIVPIDDIHQVQHVDGGAIDKIYVKEGSKVTKGQTLVELDGSVIRSQLTQAKAQLHTLLQKQTLLEEQMKIRASLYKKGLNSKISLLNIQTQKSEIDGKISETTEIISRYEAQIGRLIITSPIDGHVHNVLNKTSGEVLEAGKSIMEIIPLNRKLVAEIQISTGDIGHVQRGQVVTLKYNTYDFGRYGGMTESLSDISPMTMLDKVSGSPYFKGIVTLSQNHLGKKAGRLPIIPGMTLTAEIKTGQKTIIEYLLKPIYLSAKSALREK